MQNFNKIILSRKKNFKAYTKSLWMNIEMKGYICDDVFIDKNPAVYLFYPEVFSGVFFNQTKYLSKKVEHLNIAGYFFYRSIIEVDSAIDRVELPKGKQPEKHVLPILSSICQEESIKLLTSLFPLKSNFWKVWNIRREEYFKAIIIDKRNPQNFTLEQFELLADYKSAFGKIAIDAVYHLSSIKNKNAYHILLESHKFFSIGFQLLDDLIDFKKDLINPQVNYAYISLILDLKSRGIIYDDLEPDLLRKYLYVYGTAERLVNLAVKYFDKSLKLVQQFEVDFWKIFIRGKIKEAQSMLLHMNAYDKVIFAKVKLSNIKIKTNGFTITDSLRLAKGFILNYQNSDGAWEDYYNNAGLSNIWSTGFVLSNLTDLQDGFKIDSLEKASAFLLSNKQGEIWGYNTKWIEDIDSTTFVLYGLNNLRVDFSRELLVWLNMQQPDGGFSTYPNIDKLSQALENEFSNLNGWTQSHTCVSASAYHFLCGFKGHANYKNKLKNYLIASQNKDGLLDSYWWTSPIYATSFFLRAIAVDIESPILNTVQKTLDSLLNLQKDDGSFIDNYSCSSPFYTALAINALCANSIFFEKYTYEIRKGVNWLLANQFSDGSFDSTYSLQIPLPNVIDISKIKDWSSSKKQNTNIVINDFMRLFTTSAIVKCLDSYLRIESK